MNFIVQKSIIFLGAMLLLALNPAQAIVPPAPDLFCIEEALEERDSVVFNTSADPVPNDTILPFVDYMEGGVAYDGSLSQPENQEAQKYFELLPFSGGEVNGSIIEFWLCGQIAGLADQNSLVAYKDYATAGEEKLTIFADSDGAGSYKYLDFSKNHDYALALKRGANNFFSKDGMNANGATMFLVQKAINGATVTLPNPHGENPECSFQGGDYIVHIEDKLPSNPECSSGSDCDYNDMTVVVRQTKKLLLTSMCSDNPASERRWRVRNSNNFDLDFTYQVYPGDPQGPLIAPANSDFFFYTETVGGPNTVSISVNGIQHNVKASSGASCGEFSVSTECTGAAEVTYTVSVTDGSLVVAHDYTVSDSEGIVAAGTIPALSAPSSFDIVASPAQSPYTGILTLEIPTLGVVQDSEMFEDYCGNLDCAGTPGGNATVDDQGACCLESERGLCDGLCFSSDESCIDCAGQPFGSFTLDIGGTCCAEQDQDQCGECFGDGTSCLFCDSLNISSTLFTLDSNALVQSRLVRRASRMAVRNGVPRAFRQRLVQRAKSLYEKNWAVTWSIPEVINQCDNQQFCVEVSNASQLAEYNQNSEILRNLSRRAIRRARRSGAGPNLGRRVLSRANGLHQENLVISSTVPLTTSSCTTSSELDK